MTIRSLAIGLGFAAAALSAIAAPAPQQGSNDGASSPPLTAEIMLRRNGSAEACRDIVWPYVPSACLRNADDERKARPVRIIALSPAAEVR
jgi:hypothetical protein